MLPPQLVTQMWTLVHDAGLDMALDAFLTAESRRWEEFTPEARRAWRHRALADITASWAEADDEMCCFEHEYPYDEE